jgi:hypothetical protein
MRLARIILFARVNGEFWRALTVGAMLVSDIILGSVVARSYDQVLAQKGREGKDRGIWHHRSTLPS